MGATTYGLWVPGKHPSLGGDRLDLLNLTHSSTWADISSCTESVHVTLFWKTLDTFRSISNSTHVDLDLPSFGMFYNSKSLCLSLLPQSTLSHSRFTALQMPSASSKWDVKPSGCRMASTPYVRNTSTQSNLIFKLMGT